MSLVWHLYIISGAKHHIHAAPLLVVRGVLTRMNWAWGRHWANWALDRHSKGGKGRPRETIVSSTGCIQMDWSCLVVLEGLVQLADTTVYASTQMWQLSCNYLIIWFFHHPCFHWRYCGTHQKLGLTHKVVKTHSLRNAVLHILRLVKQD